MTIHCNNTHTHVCSLVLYVMLYYIVLYYIILIYIYIYYIALCYIILYYIILYYAIFYYRRTGSRRSSAGSSGDQGNILLQKSKVINYNISQKSKVNYY